MAGSHDDFADIGAFILFNELPLPFNPEVAMRRFSEAQKGRVRSVYENW